jgi:hypothetical protein
MVKGNNNSESEFWVSHGGNLVMPSSALRGLAEDGATTEQYEHNSDTRQYCIVDFNP